MRVDVTTNVEISCPREEVANYAGDPTNATAWYENIKRIEWKTAPPLSIGSKIAFVAHFLRRELTYTYEVHALDRGVRLMMRTDEGPFPMETTYLWEDTAGGGTRMTLRNRGTPTGFASVASPLLAAAMRRANKKDLSCLRQILERDRNG